MSTVSTAGSVASSVAGAATGGVFSVLNTVVNNLFAQGREKQKQQFQQALSLLNTQQQYDLAVALQQTNDNNKKLEILTNAVTAINQAKIQASAEASMHDSTQSLIVAGILVIGALGVLTAAFLIRKSNSI